MFIDSHAHLTSDQLFPDMGEILNRAFEAGIEKIINICTDKTTLERGLALETPLVHNAGATTPHDVEKEGERYFPLFASAAKKKSLIAIGETGLDYFYSHSDKETQKAFFIRYLELALETDLPVIVHCRDAFDDLFAIADAHYDKPLLLHCFTGSMGDAEKALKRDYLISLSGIITFKKSEALREIAREVPLSSLVIETDAPYLAPQSKRGSQNEPSFLPETAALLAEVKQLSLDEVAAETTTNAKNFFSIY